MQAISLAQPWASVVARGPKRVENRMEPSTASVAQTLLGQRIAIHASRHWRSEAQHKIITMGFPCGMQVEHAFSAILGVATITHVHRFSAAAGPDAVKGIIPDDQLKWVHGPWVLVFADVVPCTKPVPWSFRGGSWGGFRTVPADVELKVIDQLEVAGG